MSPPSRLPAFAVVLTLGLGACTGDAPPASGDGSVTGTSPQQAEPCARFVLDRNDGACVDEVELGGSAYAVGCVEVPEFLLDVKVRARWGGGAVRSIAAIPSAWAVAVEAGDDACGEHTIAIRDGLDEAIRRSVVEEVEAAAALPADP